MGLRQRRLDIGGDRGGAAPSNTEYQDDMVPLSELQRRLDFEQKVFDDRTIVPSIKWKVPERPHSSLHLIWGALLLLVVLFVRRLPRFPGVKPARAEPGDPLMYWEAKNILGENPKEGLQRRLRANPHLLKGFSEFAQLSKESLDRRDKTAQRIYSYQREMVDAFNPLLIVTDRIEALLKQLPPQAQTLPPNAKELRTQLQLLSEAEANKSYKKAEFLENWDRGRMKRELYTDPAVINSLRQLMDFDSAHMRKKIALLEFLTNEASKAVNGCSIAPVVKRELQALETKVQHAANDAQREAAKCMELLPPQDRWMLLLFVDHIGPSA
ncbi:hypothetical protein, conserved [Eimeria tenella]|uniref:Uncharacterized protein n=1 Tax=Eimeria tenella TaxID=5802 RepID=H9B9D0_EIMTE|nr:hypothetical protein, conserved [Eimeria tenella]AET50590.1 hypothetical protein [Eimeria tenella]CDJ39371.1 hypothetical protein, conserved [Eimeria tenella]|eukprot:XP_013230126.1 hypothetical protein, conserved [Eimeria tenella]